jgi:hypothetical protein
LEVEGGCSKIARGSRDFLEICFQVAEAGPFPNTPEAVENEQNCAREAECVSVLTVLAAISRAWSVLGRL